MYIDIHTHKKSGKHVAIQNIFLQNLPDFIPDTTACYSVGLHPWHINLQSELSLKKLQEFGNQARLLAIGECGLDWNTSVERELQLQVFESQILISEYSEKPMIIHAVKSLSNILFLRKKYRPKQTWIIHAFSGSEQIANQLIDNGLYLSFGKILFHENSKATRFFSKTSHTAFFLETDESKYEIEDIYKQAAKLKNISEKELKGLIIRNFESCFSLLK